MVGGVGGGSVHNFKLYYQLFREYKNSKLRSFFKSIMVVIGWRGVYFNPKLFVRTNIGTKKVKGYNDEKK
jgi:hypothetical protein